jgi:hypothetical protein
MMETQSLEYVLDDIVTSSQEFRSVATLIQQTC